MAPRLLQTLLRNTPRRLVSTTTTPYPFSSTATVIPSSSTAEPPNAPLGDSLLRHLNSHLARQHPLHDVYSNLFSRRSKTRVLPGSVVTVTSYTSLPTTANPSPSTNTFSGVLIGIRRRHQGQDHSIRLRNLVGRTGVEQVYKVWSPMIKNIKVVSAAATSGPPVYNKDGTEKLGARKKPALRAAKRAKMYFVRDQPNRSVLVSGSRWDAHVCLEH